MWTPGICMMFLVVPRFSVRLSSARVDAALRSEVFAGSVLDERVTLVTGGGTGLGKAAARELAGCGAPRGIARPGRGWGPRVGTAGGGEGVLAAGGGESGPGAPSAAGDAREPADAERIVRACLDR